MNRLKELFFCCFLLMALASAGQQGNVWCFGYHAGLDFNYSPPKVISSMSHYPNLVDTAPATMASSISNCNGQLLFYGNAGELFNKNNKRMPNGDLSRSDAFDQIYIVQMPGDSNKFYVFHTLHSGTNRSDTGLYYSIVDMQLDSGRGDVVVSQKEIKIDDAWSTFTVIKNRNGKDFWLISLEDLHTLNVYPVTKTGIGSPNGRKIFPYLHQLPGLLRGNHRGDKLILISWVDAFQFSKYNVSLYDFDNSTGGISGTKMFHPFNGLEYGWSNVDFSSNDSFFYLAKSTLSFNDPYGKNFKYAHEVDQYETYATNIDLSLTVIYRDTLVNIDWPFSFQLGPDNKIYAGRPFSTKLAVIHRPNAKGSQALFSANEIELGHSNGSYMPNVYFPVRQLSLIKAADCQDTVRFGNKSDSTYFKSFKWYFGDGDSSTAFSPKHAFKYSGKFHVKLLGLNECNGKQWFDDTVIVTLPPYPGFTQSKMTYSCGKADLTLTATSKDTTNSFSYDFGDKSAIVKLRNPTHTYLKSGTYLIKQIASNGHCKDSAIDSVRILIEPAPKANFTTLSMAGCTPYPVFLSNTSTGTYHYQWKFDDGTSDSNRSPVHIFKDTGWHGIKLLGYNHQGCLDSIKKDSFIYVSPQPIPKFRYTMTNVCGGVKLVFTNESQFANSYVWDFGNGLTSSLLAPVIVYKIGGTYKVTLAASNPFCNNLYTLPITISLPPAPKANFKEDRLAGCIGMNATFTNQSQNAVKILWQFSNGGLDSAQVSKHAFPKPGFFSVTIKAFSAEGCVDSLTKTIRVLPIPIAKFSVDNGKKSCESVLFTFGQESLLADSFRWNFGDNSPILVSYTGTTQPIQHAYAQSGNYKVTLTAMNGYCGDTISKLLKVYVREKAKVDFKADKSKACIYDTIRFTNLSSEADSFFWEFGNGTSSLKDPSISYNVAGSYSITLHAYTKEGCWVEKTYPNLIKVTAIPSLGFSQSVSEGCTPMRVTFNPQGLLGDTSLHFVWNFDDGTTSTETSPTIIIQKTDKELFWARMHVTNGSCTYDYARTIHILNLKETKDTVQFKLATVEDNQNVRLYWQKLSLAYQYKVLRSVDGTQFTTTFETSDTTYLDKRADVGHQSYYYKVIGVDACGGTSAPSIVSRTILLNATKIGEDESCTLSWNLYQGFSGLSIHTLERDQVIVNASPILKTFADAEYFDLAKNERCYIVKANSSDHTLVSMSNEVCVPFTPRIFIPNIFTPNADHINDSFQVITTGIKWYQLTIYNRWGEKVFDNRKLMNAWDGKFNGSIIPEGIYIYTLIAKTPDEQWLYRTGNINVLR